MTPTCETPVPFETLVDGSLGELPGEAQDRFDEHVLSCAACHARLEAVVRLGADIARAMSTGAVSAWVTEDLVRQIEAAGRHVHHYRLRPGETVPCTVSPDDVFVATHLTGPFPDDRPVRGDIAFHDLTTGAQQIWPVGELPIDRDTGTVVMLHPGEVMRAYPRSHITIALRTDDGSPIGTYHFDHTPWESR